MSALLLLLAVLAVWRLARLLTIDFLLEPWRFWMARRGEKLGYLAECPWCTSIWLAPAAIVPAVLWPDNRAVWIVLACLAASGVAGMLATIEDRLDR